MGFKRKGSRVEVSRAGRLQRGALSAPCKVLDVSEAGVKIESRLFVKSGDAPLVMILSRENAMCSPCRPCDPRSLARRFVDQSEDRDRPISSRSRTE
jgi:hypothetical protein